MDSAPGLEREQSAPSVSARRVTSPRMGGRSSSKGVPLSDGVLLPEGIPLLEGRSNGRFGIPLELAILTGDILRSGSRTTLVEKMASSFRAATSVTRRGPHPGGGRRPMLGEGK
jgi:hypothetical protein